MCTPADTAVRSPGIDVARPEFAVDIGPIRLATPVMPASGCFGPSLAPFLKLDDLGCVVTKTTFPEARKGNPPHRLTDFPGGMLNSVGIPSPGIEAFKERVWPQYQQLGRPIIASVGGLTREEFVDCARHLSELPVAGLELNVSCPNLEKDGAVFGSTAESVSQLLRDLRRDIDVPLIVKLSPNVGPLQEIANAAEEAGATALTICNTMSAMAVDLMERRTTLGMGRGGLSGPALKPIALGICSEIAKVTSLPIIGCGGIETADDVLEYLAVGGTAVQVGTANFARPSAMSDIVSSLPDRLEHYGFRHLSEVGPHTIRPRFEREEAGMTGNAPESLGEPYEVFT